MQRVRLIVLLLTTYYLLSTNVAAFTGPQTSAGVGTGAIGVNAANNLSVGTSTPIADTKFFLVASSTGSAGFALQVVQPVATTTNDSSFTALRPLFVIRNDAAIGIGGPIAAASGNNVVIHGPNVRVLGTLTADAFSGPLSGTLSAANIMAGTFGSNTGFGNFTFGTSTNPILHIDNTNARVGIGTTGPGALLDVYGSLGSTRISGNQVTHIYSAEANPRWQIDRDAGGSGLAGIKFGAGGVSALDTTIARISGGGLAITGGNVGIGTTSPSFLLHTAGTSDYGAFDTAVAAGGNPFFYLRRSRGTPTAPTIVGLGDDANFAFAGYDGAAFRTMARISGVVDGTPGAADMPGRLDLATTLDGAASPTVRMTIKNDGNVGIGTTNPTSTLTVAGEVKSTSGGFRFPDGTTQTTAASAGLGGSGTANYVPKWTATTTLGTSVIYDNGTNVGIGTTGPGAKLEVGSNSLTGTALRINMVGGNNHIQLAEGGTDSWVLYSQSNALKFYRNGVGDKVTFDSGGNVGIGTTVPGYKLDVSGTYHVTGASTLDSSLTFTQGASTRNVGIIGAYDPTKPAAIWAMGAAYQLGSDGSAGSLYGLSYSFEPDYGGVGNNPGAKSGLGHQMQWRANGTTQTAIGSGIWTSGNLTLAGGGNIYRTTHSSGYLVGSYNNVAANSSYSNPIYTIGSGYMPTDASSSSMYGIGYSHGNFWGTATNKPNEWGLYVASNGGINVILGSDTGIIWAASDVRAPIFYDTANTGYYLDPAGTSNLNRISVAYTPTASSDVATKGYVDAQNWGLKSVQRGTITIPTNSGLVSGTATITAVNTSKAFVNFLGATASDDSTRNIRVELTNGTTVTAYRNSVNNLAASTVSFEVIEFY